LPLLRDGLFSPFWLLRLLLAPPLLARSLWARLFCELALPPLLAAWARLLPPRLEDGEDFGIRDAIDISFDGVVRPAHLRKATARL
jgi:hypothetical protein